MLSIVALSSAVVGANIDVSFSILITFFSLDLLSTRGKKTDPPHPSTKRGFERSEVELTRKRDLGTLFLQQGLIDSWLVHSFILIGSIA